MRLPTTEIWRGEEAAMEALKKNGERGVFEGRVRGRIQLVVDSAAGRRTLRNLWGFNPVRQQELFRWNDGRGLPESTFVGGKYLSPSSYLGGVGETLVNVVMSEFGKWNPVSEEETGRDDATEIKTKEIYQSEAGVQFHRLTGRANSIRTVGGPEEFVPGVPFTSDIIWRAVFPK